MAQRLRPTVEHTRERLREKHSIPAVFSYSTGDENANPMSERHRDLLADETDDEDTSFPASDQLILDSCGFTVDLTNKLGEGAFGAVYAAVGNSRSVRFWHSGDRSLSKTFEGRRAAVKHIHIDRSKRQIYRNIRRELQVIAQLCHPNVVYVFDVFVIRVRAYVVMEFCPDGTLQDFRERCADGKETLTESVYLCLVRQITDTLLYLHELSVKHGNLKMCNIMVFKRENYNDIHNPNRVLLKLIDYGFSHFMIGNDSKFFVQLDMIYLARNVRQLMSVVRDMDKELRRTIDGAADDMAMQAFQSLSDAIARYEFLHPEEHSRLNAGQISGNEAAKHSTPNSFKTDTTVQRPTTVPTETTQRPSLKRDHWWSRIFRWF